MDSIETPSVKRVVVPPLERPIRLDLYISQELSLFSRSQWERRRGIVHFEGKQLKASHRLAGGERLELSWFEPKETSLEAQPVPLDILWEDVHVVVLNKSRGLVVHPAAGHSDGTVVNGLLHHVRGLEDAFEEESASLRPGIVHRLDKDTTGVLICAKNPEILEVLARQFRDKTTEKLYWAIVKGRSPRPTGSWKTGLARDPRNRQRFAVVDEGKGKWSWTDWRVVETQGSFSWLELRPHTGRTHQLRVHCAAASLPIVGDPLYSRPDPKLPFPLLLHARSLTLVLPNESETRTFTAPVPEDFRVGARAVGFQIPE